MRANTAQKWDRSTRDAICSFDFEQFDLNEFMVGDKSADIIKLYPFVLEDKSADIIKLYPDLNRNKVLTSNKIAYKSNIHWGIDSNVFESYQVKPITYLCLWLKDIYNTGDADINGKLRLLYSSVNRLVVDGDYTTCNRLLAEFKYGSVKPEISIGLLRILQVVRTELPSWDKIVSLVSNLLVEQGLDTDVVLRGLK